MNRNTKQAGKTVLVRVHNPAPKFTLGLPGEKRKSNMATTRKANRKRTRSRRGKRRNTASASVRQSTALAPYRASAPARRSNPRRRRRKGGRRRNPAIARRSNPFGKIGGLSVMDLAGGAIGLIVDGVLQLVVPASWLGIGIRGVGAVAMVKYLPKSVGPAAGLTAGAMVVKSAADKAFNLSGLLNAQVIRFIPAGNGGNGQLAGGRRVANFRPVY